MTLLYRLALRLCLPEVSDRLESEALATAASLAREAASKGRLPLARYWALEFTSLARLGWRERSQRKGFRMRSMFPSLLRDVRYSLRALRKTPAFTAGAILTVP